MVAKQQCVCQSELYIPLTRTPSEWNEQRRLKQTTVFSWLFTRWPSIWASACPGALCMRHPGWVSSWHGDSAGRCCQDSHAALPRQVPPSTHHGCLHLQGQWRLTVSALLLLSSMLPPPPPPGHKHLTTQLLWQFHPETLLIIRTFLPTASRLTPLEWTPRGGEIVTMKQRNDFKKEVMAFLGSLSQSGKP